MMRNKMLVSSLLLLLLGCTSNNDSKILVNGFTEHKNFMPLETLDLSIKGIKDKIHVIYVNFDPDVDEKAFPGDDNVDHFSFKIEPDGAYRPLFKKSALVIGSDYKGFFLEDQEAYEKAKAKKGPPLWVDISNKPDWLQTDETPLNSKGKPMMFICQTDIGRMNVNDDCRLFVFYDEADRIVRYIYQRT